MGVFLTFALVAFPAFDAINGMPADAVALDTRQTGYGAGDVRALFEELGRDGRVSYIRQLVIADVAWPIIYGTSLVLLIAWGLAESSVRLRTALLVLPLATVAIDAVENTLIVVQLARFPDFANGLATATGVVTVVKWVTAWSATIAALGASVVGLVRLRR